LSIFFRRSSDAAVHEWIGKYPALTELAKDSEWFEPLMDDIALHLATSSVKGAMFRLCLGVGLSSLDLGSDITMIVEFFSTEGLGYFGWVLLAMVLANIIIALLMTYVQNRKKAKWEIAKECMYVVTGLMPGVVAYRVAKGKKRSEEEMFDSKLELTFTKGIEMFAEGSKFRVAACLVCFNIICC
jgi:hypothetical protein